MTLIQSCKPPMRTARFNHITENDMKTYVLTLSEFFPSTHIRKGEPTHFRDAFNAGQVLTEVQSVYTDTQRSTRYEQTILCGKTE